MNAGSPYKVTIVGAGLAGSEAAWQLASLGIPVRLIEMRPLTTTKAHKTGLCAELVCSNSFRGAALTNAVGLLKEELSSWGTLFMKAARHAEVPAGGALAVDRDVFSSYVDQVIRSHPMIEYSCEEISSLPEATAHSPVLISTGPLTSPLLAASIRGFLGEQSLAFFDAISPIMLDESLDHSKLFRMSRYGKGGGDDYLNIPLSKDEYLQFIDEVSRAEKFGGHDEVEADCISELRPFEGCMPIDDMLARGPDTLRYGPMKPVGLTDPSTGKRPYAVVQLRQDDKGGKRWSMVGFQTRLKHPEQLRIFRMLPGLANAEFVRLGSVHRNSFIDSPKVLLPTLQTRKNPYLFFAGQITGVEGYVESTAAGVVAATSLARVIQGLTPLPFPEDTAMGALIGYVSDPTQKHFQPMNVSFGLMKSYLSLCEGSKKRKISKDEVRLSVAKIALEALKKFKAELQLSPTPASSSTPSEVSHAL